MSDVKVPKVRKVRYWCAAHPDDAAYNIRARTKQEALRRMAADAGTKYDAPVRVEIPYRDAFHLVFMCSGEGGNYHEPTYQGPAGRD